MRSTMPAAPQYRSIPTPGCVHPSGSAFHERLQKSQSGQDSQTDDGWQQGVCIYVAGLEVQRFWALRPFSPDFERRLIRGQPVAESRSELTGTFAVPVDGGFQFIVNALRLGRESFIRLGVQHE